MFAITLMKRTSGMIPNAYGVMTARHLSTVQFQGIDATEKLRAALEEYRKKK